MNKTAILSYIVDEIALKCRNVSSNMRKRIHYMLKYKEITVRKYDVRALVLNGWITVGKYGPKNSKVEEMKKGISNYRLCSQEQFDKVMTLNNEVRCYSQRIDLTGPIEVEFIEESRINQNNYEKNLKCSFNKAKFVEFENLSTDQIKSILPRFKSIDWLDINRCSLESIDLSQSRIKRFRFAHVSFKEKVYLPKEIEQLDLTFCISPNLVKAQRVHEIGLFTQFLNPKGFEEFTSTLKGVKYARIGEYLRKCFASLPSTVRKIEFDESWDKLSNLEKVVEHFPYLIDANGEFPIEATNKANLRRIEPEMICTEEKFDLRPRKIQVTSNNAKELNNHPELFEKVELAVIKTKEFNYDLLPNEIKRINVSFRANEESITLNRLEK